MPRSAVFASVPPETIAGPDSSACFQIKTVKYKAWQRNEREAAGHQWACLISVWGSAPKKKWQFVQLKSVWAGSCKDGCPLLLLIKPLWHIVSVSELRVEPSLQWPRALFGGPCQWASKDFGSWLTACPRCHHVDLAYNQWFLESLCLFDCLQPSVQSNLERLFT